MNQLARPSYYPWLMWLFPLSFFAFQFILRLFPGLTMNEFIAKYNITTADFGFFASLYYIGYAGLQIPMAFFLDRFGGRVVIAISAFLCAAAVFMATSIDAWWAALVSRFFIGAASVAGFLGVSKIVSTWFPREQYGRMIGLSFSFGLLGAVFGGRPVSLLIDALDWQTVLALSGVVAFVLGILTLLFLRDRCVTTRTSESVPTRLLTLCRQPSLLCLAFANFFMVGTLEGFADVWGVPFLMEARQITKIGAAGVVSLIPVGMLFGGPLLSYFSEKWDAHYGFTGLCGLLMAGVLFSVIVFGHQMPYFLLATLMLLLGMLCCYQVLVFAIGAKIVDPAILSVTVAFLNCVNMMGGSFFHNAIGGIAEFISRTSMSTDPLKFALLVIPVSCLLGVALLQWSQKTTASRDGSGWQHSM